MPSPQRLAAGSRLGAYEILGLLAAGGMGEVYRARDPRLERQVAIKLLPPELASDRQRLARFEAEARSLAALDHPNIVTIFSVEEADGVPFLTMALVEGRTLDAVVPRGGLTVDRLLEIAVPLAEAVAAAHGKGFTHRDLKPGNVMVSEDGRVRVLDFGLAKGTSPAETSTASGALTLARTEAGSVLGTLPYMAPEQLQGKPLDPRTDVFALGVILHELATGARPFQGGTAAELSSSILRDDPPAVDHLRPGLPEHLARVIHRCLRKDPARRYGSARELAAELQGLAEELATEQILGRKPPGGHLSARTLAAWLGAAAALAALVALWATRHQGGHSSSTGAERAAPIRSLAVLPFDNLMHDPEQDYLVEGIHEALIANLAQIKALKVISRTSVMRYQGARERLPQIAAELGVEGIVEGSVLRVGDRVRITAQLLHAPSDRHLWARSYERQLGDVLALQADVAQAIARRIRVELTPGEEQRLAVADAVDPRAHELYLKGRHLWSKRTPSALAQAIAYFEQALTVDADYAAAHAGLANCYVLLGLATFPPTETAPKAEAEARRALELDESLAEAHSALAYARTTFDWDWEGAERSFERALDISPSYANAHFWYAAHLAARGRLQAALAQAQRAQELDPVAPIIGAGLAWMHHFARRPDRVVERCLELLELEPDFAITHMRLAVAYRQLGRHDEAIAHAERALELTGESPDLIAELGIAYAAAGREPEARSVLERLARLRSQRYVPAYEQARLHAALGEIEAAFDWLERAYAERSWYLAFLKVEPDLDPLRSDPRFAAFISRLGLSADS